MKAETVAAIYEELDRMVVPLVRDPQKGLEYFSEQMLACRRLQDRVADLQVQVHREFSRVKIAVRAVQASLTLVSEASAQGRKFRDELRPLQDEYDELSYLAKATDIKGRNLRQCGSDIRLLVNIIKEQLGLGEVQPHPRVAAPVAPVKTLDEMAAALQPPPPELAPEPGNGGGVPARKKGHAKPKVVEEPPVEVGELLGIPVVMDPALPEDVVELRAPTQPVAVTPPPAEDEIDIDAFLNAPRG